MKLVSYRVILSQYGILTPKLTASVVKCVSGDNIAFQWNYSIPVHEELFPKK